MITMVDAQRVHGRWRTSAYVVALTAVVAVASSLLLVPPVHATHEAPAERGVEEACPPRQVPDPGFDDVGGNAHEAAIACIAAWDIAEGRNATVYDPAGRTRRDQMASFIVRMLDTAGVDVPQDAPQAFDDVPPGNVHFEAVNALAQMGVVAGQSTDTYQPARAVRIRWRRSSAAPSSRSSEPPSPTTTSGSLTWTRRTCTSQP